MLNAIPLTRYHMRKIKTATIAITILFLFTIVVLNFYNIVIKKGTRVNPESYVMSQGFPLFTAQKEYIALVKNYPRNPGVKLRIHAMQPGESYWNVTNRYNITIDTLIAANPFLNSLDAKEGVELVIPAEDGVLFAFNDFIDVLRMSSKLDYKKKILGDYLPKIYKLISNDDIRLVFFPDARPAMVNPSLERLYSYRSIFQAPLKGAYSSMFGDRVDPFYHAMAFHNGVDIMAPYSNKIHPSREGMVIYTGWRDGYGQTIVIQHNDGYCSLYAHCSKMMVKVGEWVTKENVIGLVGSTGRSTGPHLHFTLMLHDKIINPLIVIW